MERQLPINTRFILTQSSRAQILKNATDYIMNMKNKSNKQKSAIDDLRSENHELEEQSKYLLTFTLYSRKANSDPI